MRNDDARMNKDAERRRILTIQNEKESIIGYFDDEAHKPQD